MLNLDPAKLLVILVIALVVVGPERLPRVARQLGGLLREFSRARERVITELKDQVPDLPDIPNLSGVPGLRSFLFDPEKPSAGDESPSQRAAVEGIDVASARPGSNQTERVGSGPTSGDAQAPSGSSNSSHDPSMN